MDTTSNPASKTNSRLLSHALKSFGRLSGMSFLEIMIVIVIMAAIAAIAGPALFRQFSGSKVNLAKVQMEGFRQALALYKTDNNTYPATDQGLGALVAKPVLGELPTNWNGPYLNQTTIPKDPWGTGYKYTGDKSTFTITAFGEDGLQGGTGTNADITCTPDGCQ